MEKTTLTSLSTGILLTVVAVALVALTSIFSFPQAGASTQCWSIPYQTNCDDNASSSGCTWNTQHSYCESVLCFDGDSTNQTHCMQTLNNTYGLRCIWELYGTNLCDPDTGASSGGFFGSDCTDFNNDSAGCFNSYYCLWNASNNSCANPSGFSSAIEFNPVANPSCSVIPTNDLCINISGCSWGGTPASCSGNAGGLKCSQLNKTICASATFLSTCCTWNGTGCTTTFDQGCYDSMQPLSSGKQFCEDYLVYNNQTACNEIAGSPWYMPCTWDNSTSECHFNSGAFGTSAKFDEIGTKQGCEAQGGIWKTENWVDSTGITQTDSWCEFKFGYEFGGGGNCDTACWSCETAVSAASGNTTAQASSLCQNSDLGFCEFHADSNAQNGLGWCNPKMSFVEGGGKSCKTDCGACDYMINPQAECQNSTANCVFVNDTVNAPNGVGYCYGRDEKRCANDCWSCITSQDCVSTGDGGSGACIWDNVNLYCKPSGFTGEVCFDGKDNDADTKIDCLDADCATDKFCGGDDLNLGFGVDCPFYNSNTSCLENGCVWLVDNFDNFHNDETNNSLKGFCDFPGAECWMNDHNSSACNTTSGCGWIVSDAGFCQENSTLFDVCYNNRTQSGCEGLAGCDWTLDPYSNSGRCEPMIFGQCFGNNTRHQNQTSCEQNVTHNDLSTQICTWTNDPFSPNAGHCEAICWATGTGDCVAKSRGLCITVSGLCEPTSFGGTCFNADGNQTKCTKDLNSSCSWFTDAQANNNVSNGTPNVGTTPSGWCDPKGAAGFVGFIGAVEPEIIGVDDVEATINRSYNIVGVGVRDEFNKLIVGTRVSDQFANSSTCNGVPTYTTGAVGAGQLNYTFLWYLDSDGNSTNNCAARDNSSVTGFEFLFKYQSWWAASQAEVVVSYRCINASWGATPIPLTQAEQVMCDLVGGGMAGIDKTELFKYQRLYNKSKDLRIYTIVTNTTVNDSQVLDVAGPFFYTQGSKDWKFEDCSDTGADADGDGMKAANDPDCQMYLKFGFIPMEAGFMCGDNIDNDGDTETDCADPGCKYDFACGGNGQVQQDANDKTAPKITWLDAETFPDSAFVSFDTNEPANGTVRFYSNDSACKTLNKTVRDAGIWDSFVSTYKIWHDVSIDNYFDNPDNLGQTLVNATAYFYKAEVCDINGNCATSACLNFTTKGTIDTCKSCKSTLNFPFTPPSGAAASSAMGNISFTIIKSDGTQSEVIGNAATGMQMNYTDAKNFNLRIENPTATNDSKWRLTLINASVTGKMSNSVQNFTGGGDMIFNSTVNGSFVGLHPNKCLELINAYRPKRLEVGIPGNHSTELWHCDRGLANCTNVASNATFIVFNVTLNLSLWQVPADWGC